MSQISIHVGGKPADRDEKIRKLVAQGLPTATIAARLGLSISTVRLDIQRLGLSRKRGVHQQ